MQTFHIHIQRILLELLIFKNLTLFAVFLLVTPTICAQFSLHFISPDQPEVISSSDFNYKKQHKSILSIKQEVENMLIKLQNKNYWAASVDSLVQRDSVFVAYLVVGNAFEWAKIENGNIDERALEATGFRKRWFKNRPLDIEKLNETKAKLLNYAQNNGYPFVQVWLGDVEIDSHSVAGKLYWKKNKLILFDEIALEGNASISTNYLSNYLNIKKGEPYNEQLIRNVNNRLQSLPFVRQKRSLVVVFKGDVAQVNLFLEKRNASRFDLIVGFLPRNQLTGRPLITGSFQGVLQNPFGTGKTIAVDWQRLKAETSRLQINFGYPFILNLPFGFDGKMDIYRRDSTLQDTRFDFGVQYLFEGNNYLKVFWKSAANNLLTVNEQQIIQTQRLPNVLDLTNTTLGLEYSYRKVNNMINPQKGYIVRLLGGAGIKQIRTNSKILSLRDETQPNFEFASLYDSLDLRTFQINSEASLSYFQPIGERVTIKTSIEGGLLFSQDSLYQNEIYRIGGNRLLRGFDEESVLASAYAILTVEPRLLLNETSYLFAFLDIAYLENKSIGNQLTDFPLGFGVGLSLSTPAGIVKVSYAMGKQMGNPIDFRAAKIHFGYVNYF